MRQVSRARKAVAKSLSQHAQQDVLRVCEQKLGIAEMPQQLQGVRKGVDLMRSTPWQPRTGAKDVGRYRL